MAALRSRGGHDYTVTETDPTAQYSRYSKLIDEVDLKEVYLGYDKTNGREVAWCKKFLRTNNLDTLITEAELLRNSDHDNIIKCFYYFWVEKEIELDTNVEFNMITELYSGNLRDYTQKHQVKENIPVIKKWCRQILTGLDFLHSQNQPIIHNDLKCENIFVVGKSGTIKLGDLSAAKIILAPRTSPEYDDAYARMIAQSEVYCLGLCVLQMLRDERLQTMDFSLLNGIQDQQLRNFIQKCVYPADIRPTITQLLNDPFLIPRTVPSGYTPVPATSPPRARPVLQLRSATEFDTEYRKFTLSGQRIDGELMAVTLRTTEVKNTNFVFSLTDSVPDMIDVITAEVNTNADVELMAHTLEQLRFFIANLGPEGPRLDDEPQEDNTSEPLEINVRIEEQVRVADGNVIDNSSAAAAETEGDIDNSNTAAANSEGGIDDSNIALSFEEARLMAASIPRF